MRCSYTCAISRDRCVFTSIMLLGAFVAVSASPCTRIPMVFAMVILGIPLMTFGVAAPSRIGLLREIGLSLRGLEAFGLGLLLRMVGRKRAALGVRDHFRQRTEQAYVAAGGPIAEAVLDDPLRLHHARRLALFATVLTVIGGLGLPLLYPSTYTFGAWPTAPFVVALDLLVFGLVGRVVFERMMVRLFEATHALRDGTPPLDRLRSTPLTTLLGGALGAVAALVIVGAGALACAVETSWIQVTAFHVPAFWFIRETAQHGLPLGIAAGAILGAGMGMAQARVLLKDDAPADDVDG